jgi:hypothetical protein
MTSRLAGAIAGLVFATGLAAPGNSFAQDLQFDLPPDDEFIYEEAPAEGGSFEDIPMEEAPTEVPIQRVTNPVAEFSGIDKITGRIISFDREDAPDLAVERDLVDFDESVGARLLPLARRIADTRRHL